MPLWLSPTPAIAIAVVLVVPVRAAAVLVLAVGAGTEVFLQEAPSVLEGLRSRRCIAAHRSA